MQTKHFSRRVKPATTLAGVLAPLILAALGCYFFAVATPPPTARTTGPSPRIPPHQFQADARTLLAAIGYVLQPEDAPGSPAPSAHSLPGQLAGQPLSPSALAASCSSNRAETLFEQVTNLPARS